MNQKKLYVSLLFAVKLFFLGFSAILPQVAFTAAVEDDGKEQPELGIAKQIRHGFGIELVFTPQALIGDMDWDDYLGDRVEKILTEALEKWKEKATERCDEQKNCTVKDSYVIFNNNFWYKIDIDSFAIEITAKPLTLDEFELRKEQIQREIFDLAKEMGLVIDSQRGGHIHLDESHFDNDPLLFMKFFNDCQNHWELFLGAFGFRPNNPPLVVRPPNIRKAYEGILENFLKTKDQKEWSIEMLVTEIYDQVYIPGRPIKNLSKARNNALNVEGLLPKHYKTPKKKDFRTLEIRGLEAQDSLDKLILIIRYFYARINLLRNSNDERFLKFNNDFIKINVMSAGKLKNYAPNPEKIQKAFKDLIDETRLDWKEYEIFLKYLPVLH